MNISITIIMMIIILKSKIINFKNKVVTKYYLILNDDMFKISKKIRK